MKPPQNQTTRPQFRLQLEPDPSPTLLYLYIMGRKAKPTAQLDLETLPDIVAPIFQQAQFSLANHRKNVVALHKIHEQAAQVTETLAKGKTIQLVGEAAFNKAFIGMLNRVLPVKKGVSQADKVVKFIATFVRYTSEKGGSQLPTAQKRLTDGY